MILFKASPNYLSSLFTHLSSYNYSSNGPPMLLLFKAKSLLGLGLGFPPLRSRLHSAVGSLPCALMDVAKAALNNASTKHESVAIRAENKSYSYAQLISSACKISNLLCSGDFKSVSRITETIVKYQYLSACTVVHIHSHCSSEVTNAVFSHEHSYLIFSIQVAI